MEGLKVPVWLALLFMFALGAMTARVLYLHDYHPAQPQGCRCGPNCPCVLPQLPRPSPSKGKPNGQIGANPEPLSGDAKGN